MTGKNSKTEQVPYSLILDEIAKQAPEKVEGDVEQLKREAAELAERGRHQSFVDEGRFLHPSPEMRRVQEKTHKMLLRQRIKSN